MRPACLPLLLGFMLSITSPSNGAEQGIPFKPDPPPALDGQLDEWQGVPGVLALNRRAQVTYGASQWKSPADLSAKVWLAWRQDGLYFAAEMTDDQHRQAGRGAEIYKGDNVQVFLDVSPESELARDAFGTGQFQIAFSPGKFKKTGDPFNDLPPEAYCYQPNGHSVAGIRVAAQTTVSGWNLEAMIPWSSLGMKQPSQGMALRFEVAVSDTDGTEARQEKWMTFSPEKWSIRRSRLLAAALAGTDGKGVARLRSVEVFKEIQLKVGEKRPVKFAATKPAAGQEAVLSLKARMDTPRAAGFTQALKLTLNGCVLDGSRLVDKPRQGTAGSGRVFSLVAGDRFSTFYAPDYTSADQSQYGMAGVKSCEFKLRVTDLLREGENELILANAAAPSVKAALIAAEGVVASGAALDMQVARPKAGPPTGALEVFLPSTKFSPRYSAKELPGLKLEVELGGEKFTVESELSTPDGKWTRGTNDYFRHSRTVEKGGEAIIVRDTFTNLTAENLPLMQQHRARSVGGMKRVWLAGIAPSSLSGTSSDPANPASFGVTAHAGLGLMPLNDEFQVHVANEAAKGVLGLADRQFVLRPGAGYTAEWAIVLTSRPDYFDFVNAARRLRGSNFEIKDCFAFLRAAPQTEKWSDKAFGDFVRFKSANLVCASIMHPLYHGHYPHGTAFQLVPHDNFQRYTGRVRRLLPGVRSSVYFHCYIDVVESSPTNFADARVLRANGAQADYGQDFYKIFFPTTENSYGKAVGRNVDVILNNIRADGVYWDEMEYSAYQYHYGEPWDGCSADIDPATHKIRRLKSSVTLITQPWRIALAKRIMQRGPLIANGQPHTRAMAALKFPRFVETGSPSNCTHAQLHSPIALGDHLTERSELDAYRMMLAALDYGCLYHWYSDLNVVPTHPTLTQYMYPITPLELHEGWILGRERIITKRSGLFGWDDQSTHEVHAFDDQGREAPAFKAPTIQRNGGALSEIRIAEGWSAVIVRK